MDGGEWRWTTSLGLIATVGPPKDLPLAAVPCYIKRPTKILFPRKLWIEGRPPLLVSHKEANADRQGRRWCQARK
jgi:hypothetical protein